MKLFNFLELFIKFAIKIFGGYLVKAYATIFQLIPASSILSPTVVTTSISTDVITMANMAHYHQYNNLHNCRNLNQKSSKLCS